MQSLSGTIGKNAENLARDYLRKQGLMSGVNHYFAPTTIKIPYFFIKFFNIFNYPPKLISNKAESPLTR